MNSSTLWLTVRYCDINAISLEDPLYFSCHFGNIKVGIVTTKQRIDSRLINSDIIEVIRYRVHVSAVHNFVGHPITELIPLSHLFDYDTRDVNVVY